MANNFTTKNLNLSLLYEDHYTNNEQLKGVESTKILFDSSKARITFNEKIITEAGIMDNIVKWLPK